MKVKGETTQGDAAGRKEKEKVGGRVVFAACRRSLFL